MDALRPWLDRLSAAWSWWLAELTFLVPAPLRTAFAGGNDAVIIAVQPREVAVLRRTGGAETQIARFSRDESGDALRHAVPQPGGAARWFADPVILQLPAEEVLVRKLRLPRGAARDLDGLLRHEVVRQSPLDAQSIYYDYRIVAKDAEGLDVALRIMRREPVDASLQLCRDAGIAIAAVAFAGDTARAAGGTFPVEPMAARQLRWQPRLVPALAGLVLLLALGVAASTYLRGAAIADDLAGRIEAARARVAAVASLQRELDAVNRQAAFLAQQKRNPAAVAVLAHVARTLPDDAWLTEFELNGNEVRIHGLAARAASLIAQFDASPDFTEAQFRAPLMQAPNAGMQRFDLSFKLKGGAS